MTERQNEVFRLVLHYATEAYKVMGVTDPPALPLLIHGLGCASNHPTVTELAELTNLSMKTVSRTLRTLRDMGMIELQTDEKDERYKRIILTRKGSKILAGLYNNLAILSRQVFAIMEK